MTHTPEILSSTIVALGDFNPAIFSPDWLERNGLIGKADADTARDKSQKQQLLVSHQATTFETKWFALQVLENQFILSSKDALSPALKDLAVGIFQLVPHTPVTAVGLNFQAHFKLTSEDDYHRIGDVLAPKDIWNALCPEEAAGLTNVTIRLQHWKRGDPPPKSADHKNISLQPSAVYKLGVYMSYNDHHDLNASVDDNSSSAERMVAIIDKHWEPSWREATRVFDGVLSAALLEANKR
ncbi:MAG TPA: hypothetical protein VJN94_05265 [Candidatus Binataceae bacterium]|nr:hypothetical protein [Candidatus Binataceae bacterium]